MDGILSKADLKLAAQALYQCNQVDQQIEAAKACGLDCAEEETRCQHLKDFLSKVQETYQSPMNASR